MNATVVIIAVICAALVAAFCAWDKLNKNKMNFPSYIVGAIAVAVCIVASIWTERQQRQEEYESQKREYIAAETTESRLANIRAAIISQAAIVFDYDGLQRVVHPHRLGRSGTGNILLRAYEVQRAGETVGHWRMYIIDKMIGVKPNFNYRFVAAPDYKTPDELIPEVFEEIPIN